MRLTGPPPPLSSTALQGPRPRCPRPGAGSLEKRRWPVRFCSRDGRHLWSGSAVVDSVHRRHVVCARESNTYTLALSHLALITDSDVQTPGTARGPTSGFNPKKLQTPAPTLPFVPSRASFIPPSLALTPFPLTSVNLPSSALDPKSRSRPENEAGQPTRVQNCQGTIVQLARVNRPSFPSISCVIFFSFALQTLSFHRCWSTPLLFLPFLMISCLLTSNKQRQESAPVLETLQDRRAVQTGLLLEPVSLGVVVVALEETPLSTRQSLHQDDCGGEREGEGWVSSRS